MSANEVMDTYPEPENEEEAEMSLFDELQEERQKNKELEQELRINKSHFKEQLDYLHAERTRLIACNLELAQKLEEIARYKKSILELTPGIVEKI